ncbi:MAG: AraC family transcriptional regulator [Polyangiaceae bacterium]|nr:AraC family transcriptional regulator [Polyangiaceae bacterium]
MRARHASGARVPAKNRGGVSVGVAAPSPRTEPSFFSAQISSARRFCLSLDPDSSERLGVPYGGCEHCAPDYVIERDKFPYFTIEFVAKGEGKLVLNGAVYSLTPGTLFSYGPNIPHRITTDPRDTLVKYFVGMTGTEAEDLLRRYGPVPGTVVHTSAPSDILALYDDLIRSSLRGTAFTEQIAALVLEQIILRIAETSVAHGLAGGAAFATYFRCRRHIEEHWGEVATLDQLASECQVDPAYVCRLFRRFDQQSPYQYLLKQKMTHAANRLMVEGVSVKQVADELGFSDAFHFSRVFRKVMGMPPGRFARLHHKP